MSNAARVSVNQVECNAMPDNLRYQVLVSAKSAEEAIEIASEAIPDDTPITRVHAENVADREGVDSWLVTLWFAGGHAAGPEWAARKNRKIY